MAQAAGQKRGDVFFLNLRFLLITTVFLGNVAEPLIQQMVPVKALYLWIFTFHMPLFVFVTGYFARYSLTGERGREALQQIALQYIIFQTLYSIMDVAVFHAPGIRHSFFLPYMLVWFLLSHLCWRLLLLAFLHLKVKRPVLVAVALGVLIGYGGFNGGFLSLSRTFVYLPFFIIGYSFSYERFAAWFSKRRRLVAGAAAVALFAALLATAGRINPQWLYGSFTYAELGASDWYAGLVRLGVYVLEFAASAAFLAWVPQRERIITDWGKRTVYVFLLHGFVVRLTVASGIYAFIDRPAEVAALLLAAVLCTVLLAQPFVKKWTHALIEPETGWIVRVERKAKGLLGAR